MKNIITSIFLVISMIAFAGNNEAKKIKTTTFSGKVIDKSESLTGVKVVIDNKETVIYTDFDGNFSIDNIPVGVHKISFSMIAYQSKEIEVDLSKENQLEIILESK